MRLRTKIRIVISDIVRCINIMGNFIVINRSRNIPNNQCHDRMLEEDNCLENKGEKNSSIFIDENNENNDNHDDVTTEKSVDEVEQDNIKDNNCICPLMSLLFYDCKAAAAKKCRKPQSKINDNSCLLESGETLFAVNHGVTGKKRRASNKQNIKNSTTGNKHTSLPKTSGKGNDNRDIVVFGDDEYVREDNDFSKSHNNSCNQDDNDDESMTLSGLFPSIWDLILTLYLPILIQSIFGTFYVAKSVLLNYGIPYYIIHVFFMIASKLVTSSRLQAIMTIFSNIQQQSYPEGDEFTKATITSTTGAISFSSLTTAPTSMIESDAVMGMMTNSNKGSSSVVSRIASSCNPPSFIAFLALITIAAMIVHPDGYTWIIVRKMRKSIMTVFQLSSDYWAFVVNIYGSVISTFLAVGVLMALFVFAYILHRTLKIRQSEIKKSGYNSQNKDKQKRKKRKHGNHGRNRIRNSNNSFDSNTSDHHVGIQNIDESQVTEDGIHSFITYNVGELPSVDERHSDNFEDTTTLETLLSPTSSGEEKQLQECKTIENKCHGSLDKTKTTCLPEKSSQRDSSTDGNKLLKLTKSLSRRFANSENLDGTKTKPSARFSMNHKNKPSDEEKTMKNSDETMIQHQPRRSRQRNLSRTGSVSTIDTSLTDDSSDTHSISTPTIIAPPSLKNQGGVSAMNRLVGRAKSDRDVISRKNESNRNYNGNATPRSNPNQDKAANNNNKNEQCNTESAGSAQNRWILRSGHRSGETFEKEANQVNAISRQPSSVSSVSSRWNALKPSVASESQDPNRYSRHHHHQTIRKNKNGTHANHSSSYSSRIHQDSPNVSSPVTPESLYSTSIQFLPPNPTSSDKIFVPSLSTGVRSMHSHDKDSIDRQANSLHSFGSLVQNLDYQDRGVSSNGNNSQFLESSVSMNTCREHKDECTSTGLSHNSGWEGSNGFLDELLSSNYSTLHEKQQPEFQLIWDDAKMLQDTAAGFTPNSNCLRPPPGLSESNKIVHSSGLNDVDDIAFTSGIVMPLELASPTMDDIFSSSPDTKVEHAYLSVPLFSGDFPDSKQTATYRDSGYSSHANSPSPRLLFDRVACDGHSNLYHHHNVLKENPFADSDDDVKRIDEDEHIFEAELKELGGQMVCSILDF